MHTARGTSVQDENDLIEVPPDIGLLYHYREVALCQTVSCRKYAVKGPQTAEHSPTAIGRIRDQYCQSQ